MTLVQQVGWVLLGVATVFLGVSLARWWRAVRLQRSPLYYPNQWWPLEVEKWQWSAAIALACLLMILGHSLTR